MSRLRRAFFSLWYLFKPPWDTGLTPPELLDFLERHPAGRALDLGCGTGTNAITMARQGWRVVGIDFAASAIRKARQKARQAGLGVDFRTGDVTRLEGIPGPFDLILDMGCFHGLPPEGRRAYRDNLARLLAPGGTFLLYGFLRMEGESGMGIGEEDLEAIARAFELVDKVDGTERGLRPSAWITFRKPLVEKATGQMESSL